MISTQRTMPTFLNITCFMTDRKWRLKSKEQQLCCISFNLPVICLKSFSLPRSQILNELQTCVNILHLFIFTQILKSLCFLWLKVLTRHCDGQKKKVLSTVWSTSFRVKGTGFFGFLIAHLWSGQYCPVKVKSSYSGH